MLCNILANLVVLVHLSFIVFVCLGALLVLKWPRIVWVHIPLAVWGVIVEYLDLICPLTPLENYFRKMAGMNAYQTDFIDRYIIPLIYPGELTRKIQFILGSIVLMINFAIYGYIIIKKMKEKRNG
ncbi:MAG: DUF2784 domain-containing protein [Bacteroidales bacterium]|jgi:hypothetical protein